MHWIIVTIQVCIFDSRSVCSCPQPIEVNVVFFLFTNAHIMAISSIVLHLLSTSLHCSNFSLRYKMVYTLRVDQQGQHLVHQQRQSQVYEQH